KKLPARSAFSCIAFPSFLPGDWDNPIGWLLFRQDGEDFLAYGSLPRRKTHALGGSKDGLILTCTPEVLATAKTLVKCEGPTDALALVPHLPPGWVAVTNAQGAMSFRKEMVSVFGDKNAVIIHDADEPGNNGANKVALALRLVAASVKIVHLPYDITPDHGMD